MLLSVGFSEGKAAGAGGDCDDPISALSGGWRAATSASFNFRPFLQVFWVYFV